MKNPQGTMRPALTGVFPRKGITKLRIFLCGPMKILLFPDKVRMHQFNSLTLTKVKGYPACPRSVLPLAVGHTVRQLKDKPFLKVEVLGAACLVEGCKEDIPRSLA